MKLLERVPQDSSLRPLFAPGLVLLAALGATIGGAFFLRGQETARLDLLVQRRAETASSMLWSALDRHEETLYVVRDLFNYSEEVTRQEFEGAVTEVLIRHPEISMIGWAPRITDAERDHFEAALRPQAMGDTKIVDVDPVSGIHTPAPRRSEYFPLHFAEPKPVPTCHFECDLSTHIPTSDLELTRRSGQLTACDVDRSGSPNSSPVDYFITLAVFQSKAAAMTGSDRQLQGLLCALIHIETLISNSINPAHTPDIDVIVTEHLKTGEERPLYFQSSDGTPHRLDAAMSSIASDSQWHRVSYPYGGRVWSAWFRPGEAWVQAERTHSDKVVLASGTVFSVLLASFVFTIQRRSRSIEKLVAKRTAELTEAQRQLQADLHRREEIEHALKASEERYRALVSQSSDAVWRLECVPPVSISLTPDAQVQQILANAELAECNQPTAALYGAVQPENLCGATITEFWKKPPGQHEAYFQLFIRCGYRLADFESEDVDRDNKVRVVRSNLVGIIQNGHLVRIWGIQRDMTKQRAMEHDRQVIERQLLEAQRLESLGVLAGGIAHDFNNLLTGVLGHANLARTQIPANYPIAMHLEQIERAAHSAAGLCRQMLAYAGKGRFVVKSHNLSEIVASTTHLLQVSIGKQAELRFELAERLPPILADATQIQQVVMNLVINAAEAIGERAGSITLTTGVTDVDETTFADFPLAPDVPAPRYVYLEVDDTGCGMGPDVIQRIFEPFFTTKFSGRGLGLAATLGIVRGHGGALNVTSEPERGTSFSIYLPAAEGAEELSRSRTGSGTPWKTQGMLLVIDDEAPVREIAAQMGKSLGFRVVTARDGNAGIEEFKRNAEEVSVILLDATMPGLSGPDTLDAIRKLRPDVPVVMMSGYNISAYPTEPLTGPAPTFLSKPFTLQEFRLRLQTAIGRDPDSAAGAKV